MLAYDGDKGTHYQSSMTRAQQESETALLWESLSQFLSASITSLRGRLARWLSTRDNKAKPEDLSPVAQGAVDIISSHTKIAFLPDREEHVGQLEELWSLLQPNVPYQRITKAWGDIGFQGKDPVTDLRGTGVLGLRNLLYFARAHQGVATRIVAHSRGFPFAIAAINISASTLKMLKSHNHLANEFFGGVESGELALHVFDQLFALIFIEYEMFHRQSIEHFLANGGHPELAVMQFNEISRKFFQTLESEMLARGGSLQYRDKCDFQEPETPFLATVHGSPSPSSTVPEGNLIDL